MTDITATSSCQDDYDPNSLSVEAARRHISEMIIPLSEFESVNIRQALDRTLAEDVLSTIDVPAYKNSAMDGYAIAASDLTNSSTLTITGSALAGKPFHGTVKTGECIRIMTGAAMPNGVDTVIMQEHVEVNEHQITILGEHKAKQNVRLKGEDLARGTVAIPGKRKLAAADVGLLASLGVAEVKVIRKIRVTFLSTGDELKNVGEPLAEGQIYDSNRYTIFCMLQRLGVEVNDLGIIQDSPDAIRTAFNTASKNADVIITSGGVSVGDADYVKQVIEELGKVSFWKIAMKPGRPLAVGKIKNSIFFGLPGNPVSAMVTFYQFIQPALYKMMDQVQSANRSIQISCISPLKKRPGRVEFQRGTIFLNENGEKVVKSTGNQGSHVLSSMSDANCFIILPIDAGNIVANSIVEVQPFDGLV